MPFFKNISSVKFEGTKSKSPLAYRYYNAKQKVLGKTMEEHMRLAVCFWHTFCWIGTDIFGEATFDRPWFARSTDPLKQAEDKCDAAFEFIEKLGVPYFTFHDRDVAPEGKSLADFQRNLNHIADRMLGHMKRTKIKLLWGTANLTNNRRYMAGAATNPDPDVFACAVTQVKHVLEVTHRLKGENYVLWGGREGYDTLLNTDMRQEADQFARFLSMLVDYKHKIGFKGTLLIEPKPCEPAKHQYDHDAATVHAFLQKYGLEKEYKLNIEGNHATMAGHSFQHEVAYCFANDLFGSIDANQGDELLGWDTDQFPTNLNNITLMVYEILSHGGFTTGGFNLDTKLRRQSIDLEDLFYAHVSGIDTLARALLIAARLLEEGTLKNFVKQRYKKWHTGLGKEILQGKSNFEKIAAHVLKNRLDPKPRSGRQEMLETVVNTQI